MKGASNMRKQSSNLKRKDSEETLAEPKENLARPKLLSKLLLLEKLLKDSEEIARECLLSCITRQKEMANTIGVSEARLSQLMSGKIPRNHAFMIISTWLDSKDSKVTPTEDKIKNYHKNLINAVNGPNRDKGDF